MGEVKIQSDLRLSLNRILLLRNSCYGRIDHHLATACATIATCGDDYRSAAFHNHGIAVWIESISAGKKNI